VQALARGRLRLPKAFRIIFKINLEKRKWFLPLHSQIGRENGRTARGKANGAGGPRGRKHRQGTMPHGSAGNDDKCRTVRGRRESSFKIYNMWRGGASQTGAAPVKKGKGLA